jgi:molybdopterin molybdotransferase
MVSVEEALQLIAEQVKDFGDHHVPLLQATGKVLSQPVLADRDLPPFNRVTMDGIAISLATFNSGTHSFRIEGLQAAGAPQLTLHNDHNCVEVMTGATLPVNADTVIPYELCDIEGGMATVNLDNVNKLQNVHLQGTDSRKGDLLIPKGVRINAATIGLLASAGLDRVPVLKVPRVAICATGDELVEVHEQPLAHQIRQSNAYMLASGLNSEGIQTHRYHLKDNAEEMESQLAALVYEYDVILLSGAVSKGKFDYLPKVLTDLGMHTIFHSIAQRPGKPFLFGKMPDQCLIFGFPGNPISTFVCYQLYFKFWLYLSLGLQLPELTACLNKAIDFKPALAYHMLVRLEYADGKIIATPVETSTSGDLVSLAQAEAIMTLPADRNRFEAGEVFPVQLV